MKEFNESNFERGCWTTVGLTSIGIIFAFFYGAYLSGEREAIAKAQSGLQQCQLLGSAGYIWQRECVVKPTGELK